MSKEILIDSYLTSLRSHLGPLTIQEREEIVREIGAHIRDSAEQSAASIEEILQRLGPAEKLAGEYRDGMLIRQASRSNSPLVLLRATLRLATRGVSGIAVFLLSILGYGLGGSLVLTALLKPVFPANTGMWIENGTLLGWGTQTAPPPPAQEVLGLWYIPIMLTLGSLTLLATTFAIRFSLRVSRIWQSRL
jgi:uncharacterized membrane protein